MSRFNNVDKEYNQFKLEMLSKTPHEIYDNCKIILFYENIYEYCIYNETISEEYAKLIEERTGIINDLYHLYLKYEFLGINNWSEIDDLIEIYMQGGGRDDKGIYNQIVR